jgi:hypothetical protein
MSELPSTIENNRSTSLVKYLEIWPNEKLPEPSAAPDVPLPSLSITKLQDPNVDDYRKLYNAIGGPVRIEHRFFMPLSGS